MASSLLDFLSTFGIVPKDQKVFEMAFRHPSVNGDREGQGDYERLEFLGDSLIGLAVAHLLYLAFPKKDQGELSVLKAHFVRTKAEASYARELHLDEHIVLGSSFQGNQIPDNVLEDVFESFLGAYLIDQGLDKVYAFVLDFMKDKIKEGEGPAKKEENPKSALQEAFQAEFRESVTYKILKESGPSHQKTFVAAVYFEGEELGRGEGRSKKEAETLAAAEALMKMAGR